MQKKCLSLRTGCNCVAAFCVVGQNLLFVGMHGPTVPCERLSIIHMGGHQYKINYAVKERGKYILAVKWGDEHIPGSPFHIGVL